MRPGRTSPRHECRGPLAQQPLQIVGPPGREQTCPGRRFRIRDHHEHVVGLSDQVDIRDDLDDDRIGVTRGQLDDASLAEAISRLRVEPDNAIVAVRNGQLARFNRLFPQPPKPDGQAGTFTFFRAITLRETLQRR